MAGKTLLCETIRDPVISRCPVIYTAGANESINYIACFLFTAFTDHWTGDNSQLIGERYYGIAFGAMPFFMTGSEKQIDIDDMYGYGIPFLPFLIRGHIRKSNDLILSDTIFQEVLTV